MRQSFCRILFMITKKKNSHWSQNYWTIIHQHQHTRSTLFFVCEIVKVKEDEWNISTTQQLIAPYPSDQIERKLILLRILLRILSFNSIYENSDHKHNFLFFFTFSYGTLNLREKLNQNCFQNHTQSVFKMQLRLNEKNNKHIPRTKNWFEYNNK